MTWQSMETAPRDGTEVLLYLGGRRIVGAWLPYSDISYPMQWQNCYGDVLVRGWKNDDEPDSWTHLPEPPK